MKLGQILLAIGRKITGKNKKTNKKDKDKKEVKLMSSGDGSWGCWWIFNKPPLPKIFK